jgi:hypothetical protein
MTAQGESNGYIRRHDCKSGIFYHAFLFIYLFIFVEWQFLLLFYSSEHVKKQYIWTILKITFKKLWLIHWLTNQLMTWNRVLLEKQTVTQLVKKFSTFYGTHLGTYPEQHEFSKNLCILFLKINFNITVSPTYKSSKWSLSFRFCYQNFVQKILLILQIVLTSYYFLSYCRVLDKISVQTVLCQQHACPCVIQI